MSGTAVGASTFWGITRLLGNFKDPTDALMSALRGDNRNTDLSVGDIYGGDYQGIGLNKDIIASSFGKLKDKTQEEIHELNKDDISRSLINLLILNTLVLSKLVA